MKVYLLIEYIDAWNSDEFGSPLYGVPVPVCEKVIDAFYTEEKALEALEKAELSSKKMVEELKEEIIEMVKQSNDIDLLDFIHQNLKQEQE